MAPIEAVGPGSLPGEASPDAEQSPAGVQAAVAHGVTVIRSLEELEGLGDLWDALARSGMPMQDHAWTRAAASSFAAEGRLHIVAAGVPPDVTAIAPLAWSRGGDGCLELIGMDELGEPMDFLYADPSALAPLTDALAGFGGCLSLTRVPAASPVIAALQRSYRGRGVVICRPVGGYPWIPLDARWREPEGQIGSGRRSDLRRARRIAEKMGPVSAEVVSPAPQQLDPLLEEAFRVEAASWKGREGTALAKDPGKAAFFRRYAAAMCTKGALRMCFLRIGDAVAAAQIAVTFGDRFWLLKIGYDEAFARCSPGTLLSLETIRYAAVRGLRSYEFLGGPEPWTRMWTDQERPCVSLRVYPASLRGIWVLAGAVGKIARRRLGRLFRRTPG